MTFRSVIAERLARHRQFLLFAAIGGVATFVDMGALWVAFQFGADPYVGRVFSFVAAASFTWFFNRTFTFKGVRSHSVIVEYVRFLGVNAIGGAVNFAIYSAVVGLTPRLVTLSPLEAELLPYVGVIVGSLGGLVFNFTGVRKLVFKTPDEAA